MLRLSELEAFLDIPLEVEATLIGPRMRIAEILALRREAVVTTTLPAGANVDVSVGGAVIGTGELTLSGGRPAVRMLGFRGEK